MKSRYKLFCFDMDGTLLDSMGCGYQSKIDLIRSLGVPLPPECEIWALHHSLQEVLTYYRETQGFVCDMEEIVNQYRREMYGHYERGLDPKPGALEFLKCLRRYGIRACVGTANDRNVARMALEKSGLLEYLEFVTDIIEVGSGKGEAAFFERIAQRAGVQPQEILFFEDALYAMKAAKAAGCGVIAIEEATSANERDEICAVADRYIQSYFELMEEN